MVASVYAYQIMERQRGYAEFETAQKSILVFNDGLETSAWKVGAARSTRFTIKYGFLQLVPNAGTLSIDATYPTTLGTQSSPVSLPGGTFSVVKYWLSNTYVSFDPSFETYILGNSDSVIYGSADSYGRVVIKQPTQGLAAVILDYRVRVLDPSVVRVGVYDVNYVNIRVIKLSMLVSSPWSYVHDFDLKARCINVTTTTSDIFYTNGGEAVVSVRLGESNPIEQVPVSLKPGQVVFVVSVSEMLVSV